LKSVEICTPKKSVDETRERRLLTKINPLEVLTRDQLHDGAGPESLQGGLGARAARRRRRGRHDSRGEGEAHPRRHRREAARALPADRARRAHAGRAHAVHVRLLAGVRAHESAAL